MEYFIMLIAFFMGIQLLINHFRFKNIKLNLMEEEKEKIVRFKEYYTELMKDPTFNKHVNNKILNFFSKYFMMIPLLLSLFIVYILGMLRQNNVSEFIIVPIILFLGVGFIVCIILFLTKEKTTLDKIYKEKVIKRYLEDFYNNYTYDANSGIPNEAYEFKRYVGSYDDYYTEDFLMYHLDSGERVSLSEVKTTRTDTDSDGNSTTVTTFHGLVGFVILDLKNISDEIYIGHSNFGKTPRVKMDNESFEKYYEVRSTDEVMAYKFLTPDIMEKLLSFDKRKYDFLIYENKLYFRQSCGELFDVKTSEEDVIRALVTYSRELDQNKKVLEGMVAYLKKKDS